MKKHDEQNGDDAPDSADGTGSAGEQGMGDHSDATAESDGNSTTGRTDDTMTGSEEEEQAFLEGYAPTEDQEKDWQHITTDSDAGSDYSTLTEGSSGSAGSASSDLLSLDNQSKLADIAKKAKELLKTRKQRKSVRKEKSRKRKLERIEREKTKQKMMRFTGTPVEIEKKLLEVRKKAKLERFKRYLDERGVIYIGRIPYGFYENQMRPFFKQFGEVRRIKVKRNRKGKPIGHAFVEFEDPEVAEIVAKAVDGYLLFESKLVCKVVPNERKHPFMFRGWGEEGANTEYHKKKREEWCAKVVPKSEEQVFLEERKKARKLQKKLVKLGIDYKLPEFTVREIC